jgi:hypothetical protein
MLDAGDTGRTRADTSTNPSRRATQDADEAKARRAKYAEAFRMTHARLRTLRLHLGLTEAEMAAQVDEPARVSGMGDAQAFQPRRDVALLPVGRAVRGVHRLAIDRRSDRRPAQR